MDLCLESALSKREEEIVKMPKVLLLYEERGFVHSTMELMRIAAGNVSAATPVCCAIWDFELVADPLLMRVAAREACAADMVTVALRVGGSLPGSVKGWLHLWLLAHPWSFVGRVDFRSNWECFDRAPASIDSRVEKLGELGNMDILAIGGNKTSALIAFKNEMADKLVGGTHRPLSLAARAVSPANCTNRKGSGVTLVTAWDTDGVAVPAGMSAGKRAFRS